MPQTIYRNQTQPDAYMIRIINTLRMIDANTSGEFFIPKGKRSNPNVDTVLEFILNSDSQNPYNLQALLSLRNQFDIRTTVATLAQKAALYIHKFRPSDLMFQLIEIAQNISEGLTNEPPQNQAIAWYINTLKKLDRNTRLGFANLYDAQKLTRLLSKDDQDSSYLFDENIINQLLLQRGELDVRSTLASLSAKAATFLSEDESGLKMRFASLVNKINAGLNAELNTYCNENAHLIPNIPITNQTNLSNKTYKVYKGYIPIDYYSLASTTLTKQTEQPSCQSSPGTHEQKIHLNASKIDDYFRQSVKRNHKEFSR